MSACRVIFRLFIAGIVIVCLFAASYLGTNETRAYFALRGENVNTKIAFCLPVVYGDIDLAYVRLWTDYQYRLGFELIKAYYIPGFLPDATLDGMLDAGWKMEMSHSCPEGNDNLYNCAQGDAVKRCFAEMTSREFSWVMFGDLDEFLAGPSDDPPFVMSGTSSQPPLHNLIAEFPQSAALSFGIHSVNTQVLNLTLDGLHIYPFVSSLPYCYDPKSRISNHELCTTWRGKRKSLVQLDSIECCGVHKWTSKFWFSHPVTELPTSFLRLNEIRGPVNMTKHRESATQNSSVEGYVLVDWAG